MERKEQSQNGIPAPPKGKERLKWLGPAFIWMLSAAGSGELLFTPRIAAQYGYTLIWALILAVSMKWFINREIGRYTVCTGASFFVGISSLSQRSHWLLWLILLPQLVVAVSIIAGLTGVAATAFVELIDMPLNIPALVLVAITASIILLGQYKIVEKVTTLVAIIISIAVLVAAIATKPDTNSLIKGFVPSLPRNLKFDEVLPWLGFMLAGAAGLMWFSYWTEARGYGAAALPKPEPLDTKMIADKDKDSLKGWIKHMTIANTLAVMGALVIAFAFLILGTELLKPQRLIPEENKVAQTLGRLMGDIWGQFGFWFMIVAVLVTFISTMLSAQDGYGRMFSDGTAILTKKWAAPKRWTDAKFLHKLFVIFLLCIFPALTYLIAGEPVGLLKIAGVIEACHIPVVAFLALYLNYKTLDPYLRPGIITGLFTAVAGLFFAVFAVVYILQLTGLIRLN
jgi:Mn2+/Fe2+ NRAMP family transporter